MSSPVFATLADFAAAVRAGRPADAKVLGRARARDAQLTKPPGALGRLEELAQWYASWRGTERPAIAAPQVVVFAGNHGVVAQGVSAFPSEVTAQMVANFAAGGAAINQLAKAVGARLDVHPLELDTPTADFTTAPAMSPQDLLEALQTGWNAVNPEADLLVTGEMGIGNTTSAAALAMALLGGEAGDWTGRGTGLDDAALALKTDVVARGCARHGASDVGRDSQTVNQADEPLRLLACLGGREIAAMVGAIAAARHHSIPVILDGFICCAAAAVLHRLAPGALDHCVAGHQSAEAGHARMLDALGKPALLSLDMRLGEASGGTLAIAVLKGAVACHSGMATFAEAGVSPK